MLKTLSLFQSFVRRTYKLRRQTTSTRFYSISATYIRPYADFNVFKCKYITHSVGFRVYKLSNGDGSRRGTLIHFEISGVTFSWTLVTKSRTETPSLRKKTLMN